MPNQIQAGFEFEAIFQEAAIGIIVTNSQFEILLSNKFADKLFGHGMIYAQFLVFERKYFQQLIDEFDLALFYFEFKKAEYNEFLLKVQQKYASN